MVATQTFTVDKTELMKIIGMEYARTYWWLILILPVFGITLLLLRLPGTEFIAFLALIWPLTIPLRAATTVLRLRSLPPNAQVILDDNRVIVRSEDGKGMATPIERFKTIKDRPNSFLLYVNFASFVVVPKSAFEDEAHAQEFKKTFEEQLESAIQKKIKDAN